MDERLRGEEEARREAEERRRMKSRRDAEGCEGYERLDDERYGAGEGRIRRVSPSR